MEEKLKSLELMCEESMNTRPEQAVEAVDEYLENLKSEYSIELKEKFKSKEYYKKFQTAITHTSLIVFVAAFKATQPEETIDFEQYIREYLFFARQDDKLIYNMRLFYLSNLNAQEMGIGYSYEDENLDEQQKKVLKKEVEKIQEIYNSMVNKLKEQYKERSIHLK